MAGDWVRQREQGAARFRGAFFSGSTVELPPDAELPATSDVDVVVVVEGARTPAKLGKVAHDDLLVEITYLAEAELEDPEWVALTYVLAPSFSGGQLIADPTGLLGRLEQRIGPRFAEPDEVRRRCQNAIEKIERGLAGVSETSGAPWHQQVTSWLFPASVTTHVLLVAACRNPTVRLRYPNTRAVLVEAGLQDAYPPLLDLIGCGGVTRAQVQRHLDQLASAFDAAAGVARTSYPFSADVTALARPVAIDGSQQLVVSGDHREAVFWLVATFARCQQILSSDAPELAAEFAPAFRAAVAELLGVDSSRDLFRRSDDVRQSLPRLGRTAEALLNRRASGDKLEQPNRDPDDPGVIRMTDLEVTQTLLSDSFERLRDLVAKVTGGLDQDALDYRPGPEANPIGWLVWHLTRVQDDHVADVAGVEQAWPAWRERFSLPFDNFATGYGQTPQEAGQVHVSADLLAGYHADVHALTLRYLKSLTAEEVGRVVDERWDPPVTVSVRLVSVLGDCLQHLGQAAYVRGLIQG